jgi:hypothetical protein
MNYSSFIRFTLFLARIVMNMHLKICNYLIINILLFISMLKHIVMFRLKEFAENTDRATNTAQLKTMLLALPAQISQVLDLQVSTAIVLASAEYDLVLDSSFKTQADLDDYQSHPAHLLVRAFIGKVVESRYVVDYWL